ncbi:MAG: ROK family protein, partial [Actinobacteria bacterium]|nr:ROK family protein [Actinomycetota bacterium]
MRTAAGRSRSSSSPRARRAPTAPAVSGISQCTGSGRRGCGRGAAPTLPGVGPALAVDIGGTKLAAGLVTETGALSRRAEALTPSSVDADALFSALVAVIDQARTGEEVACGVGAGGPMAPGGEEVS